MKDRLSAWMVMGLIVTAGFLGFMVFESDVVCAAPTTWYVDDVAGSSGPGDPNENFTSIQDAINACSDGDIVYVYNGTYYENIVVNRSINLTGMSGDNTTIIGGGSGAVVFITSNWVNVTGFNITNGDSGIYINVSSHNNTIKDNVVVYNNENGIHLNQSSSNNNIIYNNVTNPGGNGIDLDGATWNNISNNNVSYNTWGINLAFSSNNILSTNKIWNNTNHGIRFQTSSYNDVLDNDVFYNQEGIEIYSSEFNDFIGNNVTMSIDDGITLRDSSNNEIISNDVHSNFDEGIWLVAQSIGNLIMGNNIFDNSKGIHLMSFGGNDITDNTIWNNVNGINVYLSSGNNIFSNNLTNNNDGIFMRESSNNNVINNKVHSGGIMLYWTTNDNLIEGNNVSNGGITLVGFPFGGPTGNDILYNNVTNSSYGIYLESVDSNTDIIGNNVTYIDFGIYLSRSTGVTLSGNIMIEGGIYITGFQVNYWDTHNINISNTVNGKPVYYWKDQTTGSIPGDAGEVILANCQNILVENLELKNSSLGIELGYSSNITITGNNVSGQVYGIYLDSSENNNITGNNVSYNRDGIYLNYLSNTNVVTGNNVSHNDVIGLHTFYCNGCNISVNNVSDNREGIYLELGSNNNVFNNTITNNDLGTKLRTTDGNFIVDNTHSNNVNSIYLEDSDGNTIILDNASNNEYGIHLWHSNGNNIILDNAANNDYGIYLRDSHRNNITGSTAVNNQYGIYLLDSRGNSITLYNATDNDYGIYLNGSDGNNITGSTAVNNQYGLYLLGSDENNITDCRALSNDYGFYLADAKYNIIYANNISLNNKYGFYLINSTYNLIYHNNILYNFNQSYDDTSFNVWNETYPTGGNCWSDYTGVDNYRGPGQNISGPDGIGDTSYDIDANSRDYYPLMGPLGPGKFPPSEPLNLTAISGDSFVNLTWDPPVTSGGVPVIYYRIYKDTISGAETFYVEIGNALYFNDTGVTNTITYYYNVSAVNLMGEGPLSLEVSATPVSVPNAPQNLTAIGGTTYVNLTWNPPTSDGGLPITNYTIYRDVTPNSSMAYAVTGNVTSYNDTNVAGGIVYYYRISAVNVIGEGALSYEDSAMPFSTPFAPTGLNMTSGEGIVNLSWIAPINDGGSPVTWYHIYRDSILFHTVPSTQLWYNDTGVANGATYIYNVSARNSIGEGPKSSGVDVTPLGRPSGPLSLHADEGYCYVNLSWDAPSSNGGSAILVYNIYRNGTAGIYYTVSQEWYNDTAVVNGITYSYDITAVNGVGEGSSSMIDATPGAPPSAPQNLQAYAGDSHVNLTWEGSTDNGGFEVIVYYVYRNGLLITSTPGDQLWYNDTNAVNGVTYTYAISSGNSAGEGPKADPVSRTPMTTPGAPQNLQTVSDSTFVYMTWDAPADNGGDPVTLYTVYRDGAYHATVISGHAFNDTNVTKGTTYAYTISANNSVGEGYLSSPVDATPPATTPSAPINLQTEKGDGYVELKWDPPLDTGGLVITEYHIYRDSTKLFTVSADQPWYNDTNVINGVTYKYYLSANNSIGEGPLSAGTNATPDSPPPAVNQPPSGIIGSPLTGAVLKDTITISGSSSDIDGTITHVEIKIDGGAWTQVTGTESWNYSWDTTNVPNGVHTISIRAHDGTVYSPETTISVIVDNPSEAEEPSEEFPFQLVLAAVLIIIIILLMMLLLARKRKEPEEEIIAKEEAVPDDEEEETVPETEEEEEIGPEEREEEAPEVEEEADAPEKQSPEEVTREEGIDEEPPKKLLPARPPRKPKGSKVKSDMEGIKDDGPGKETSMVEETEETE